jgi:hypothetical protein
MIGHGKDITICNKSDYIRDFFIRVTTGGKLNDFIRNGRVESPEKTLFYDKISYGEKITIHLDRENANLTIRGFTWDKEMYQYYAIMGQAAENEKKKFKFSEFKFSVSDVDHLVNDSKFYCEMFNMSGISELTINDKGNPEVGFSSYVTWNK